VETNTASVRWEDRDLQRIYDGQPYVREILQWEALWFPSGFVSRRGFPIFWNNYGNMHRTRSTEELNTMMTFWIKIFDRLMWENPDAVTKGLCFVCDLRSMGWHNFDIRAERLGGMLFKSYPCRFKKMIMFGAPWYLNVMMAIVKPFYSRKVFRRFVSLKTLDGLTDYVDEDNLMEMWGGTRKFSYSRFVPGFPSLACLAYRLSTDGSATRWASRITLGLTRKKEKRRSRKGKEALLQWRW